MIDAGWRREIIHYDDAAKYVAELGLSLQDLSTADRRIVEGMASDMANGRWRMNGDTITFDRQGKLADGRLRMLACATAKASFPTLVITGIDPKAVYTPGSRRKRREADILKIAGQGDSAALASAVAAVIEFSAGSRNIKMAKGRSALEVVNEHPGIRRHLQAAKTRPAKIHFGPGVLAAFSHLTELVDAGKAAKFAAELDAAIMGKPSGPQAIALATALTDLKKDTKAGGRRAREYRMGYAVKAWNAFRKGKDVVPSQWDQELAVEFPQIDGLPRVFRKYFTSDNATPLSPRSIETEYERVVDSNKIYVVIRPITPYEAEQFLLRNGPDAEIGESRNRNISKATVARYARDMLAGDWFLNGQTIKVSVRGRLLDGQHRLQACVKAGVPFHAIVVHGVEEDAFATFDLTKKTTYTSVLARRGVPSAKIVDGVVRIVWQWLERGLSGVDLPTLAELERTFEAHRGIQDSVEAVRSPGILSLASPAAVAAMHYICSLMDPTVTEHFFQRLGVDQPLYPGDAAYALRRRFQRDKQEAKRGQISERSRLILTGKAWLAFYESKPVAELELAPGEEFPRAFAYASSEALATHEPEAPVEVQSLPFDRWRKIPLHPAKARMLEASS